MKPTLRRTLKYTPAVVLGLLVVAWAMSLIAPISDARFVQRRWYLHCELSDGSIFWALSDANLPVIYWPEATNWRLLGRLSLYWLPDNVFPAYVFQIPLLAPATLIAPLAIGPFFLSFRFRLWHYLAYTAIVAVELAYYLRWQQ